MWTVDRCEDEPGVPCRVRAEGGLLSYGDVLQAWVHDASFRTWFSDTLASDEARAFRWETPPLTHSTRQRLFSWVLVDSPSLDRAPDRRPFEAHFADATDGVASFANLSGDARLVVPAPDASPSAYGHLAAFLREAPEGQKHALWRRVGEEMLRRLDQRPVWLSTAGAGVPWLHVRLDDRPKYYRHAPYTSTDERSG